MDLWDDIAKTLIPEQELQTRVAELGQEVNAMYTDDDRPLLVCVLKGAFVFLADLTRHLKMRHEVDFMEISSYGAGTVSSGVVRILLDLERNMITDIAPLVDNTGIDSGDEVDISTNEISCVDETVLSQIAELEARGVILSHDCN